MSNHPIECDYLIVGAGATAMAFADTLLSESASARIVMVDRHHRPGGHWNDAYSFVRLHQPSAFYGVNSRALGSGTQDSQGFNQGLHELASGAEVLDYFDQVMNQRFLPSGRVRWLPMSEYVPGPGGEHRIRSLLDGATVDVAVRRKRVDATLARTAVPSTHAPKYRVAPGVRCVPLNALPSLRQPHPGYVVVGSGKTGIDACLWLLQNGAAPEHIRWIVPRDAWLLDRANVQPGMNFFDRQIQSLTAQLEAIGACASLPELLARLEAQGQLLRLDPAVEPGVYRCATVTQAELRALRRITGVVRLGHVQAVEPTRIVLERGSIETGADWLVVDCSASAIVPPPALPVFDGDTIHLLFLRTCQPVFSAALIAWVECHVEGEADKNALCAVVPSPALPADWLRMWAVSLANRLRWGRQPGLNEWLAGARLDGLTGAVRGVPPGDTVRQALLQRYGASVKQAAARLPQWMTALA